MSQQRLIDPAFLRMLQERAEAMTQGDFSRQGQPIDGPPEIETLRMAIDVLGAHTEQGLRTQHAYIAALSRAQEAERGRLARELHDEVVQQLIALGHGVEYAQRLVERDQGQAVERLRALRGTITTLVGELRAIIGDLRPPALAELGLLPAVQLLLDREGHGEPQATLLVEGQERRLAPQTELALFRIVQEALSNARRHAAARRVDVVFSYSAAALTVRVADDGGGFVLPGDDALVEGHWGLQGMRERAELIGGTLTVLSALDSGTAITVRIPYPGVHERDPVCGMRVSATDLGTEHGGQLYRFCSPACRDLFATQPAHYLPPS